MDNVRQANGKHSSIISKTSQRRCVIEFDSIRGVMMKIKGLYNNEVKYDSCFQATACIYVKSKRIMKFLN